MSHTLEAWLNESRKRDGAILAKGATIPLPGSYGTGTTGQAAVETARAVTVLVPEVKPLPVPIVPKELFPPSIIPPAVVAPTIILVGGHEHGGSGMPWTNGPGALMNEEWPLGSIIFSVGNAAAVTIGIYDKGESLRWLLVSYLRRNVSLRVHTGIGKAPRRGGDFNGEYEGDRMLPAPVVPHGRPKPPVQREIAPIIPPGPGGGYGPGEDYPSLEEAWGPFLGIPGAPPGPNLEQIEDSFRYFEPWVSDFFSWLF